MIGARAVLRMTSGATTIAAAAPSAYLGVLTALALTRRTTPDLDGGAPGTRFVVLVPAHDEETLIGATVASLVGQRYPTSLFDVHVVADNCSDDTAARASEAGATVHVRERPDHPGKGPALNWLVDRITIEDHDVVVIVDADTIADPDVLSEFDRAFAGGAVAAQAYYGVRDPETSPATALRYAALACRHHLRPRGRRTFGGSCGLYGNGMAFRWSLLRARRWSSHLVEDAELQNDLLLDGVRVEFVERAVVEAEMPATFDDAVTQHQRWELGRWQLVTSYVPPLTRRMITGGPLRRVVYADAIADHLVPPLSLLALVDVSAMGLAAASFLGNGRRGVTTIAIPVLASGVLVAHVMVALRAVGAPAAVRRALLQAPRLAVWKLRLVSGLARRSQDVSWTRTRRNDTEAVA